MLLTVLGIVWGTASIALMLALGEGVSDVLLTGSRNMGEGILVVWTGQTMLPFEGMPPSRNVTFHTDDAEIIRAAVPAVGELSAEHTQWGNTVEYAGKSRILCLKGVDPCYRSLRNFEPQPGGRFLNARDVREHRRVVFLGDQAKTELFGEGEEAVGKTVLLNRIPFTVIGVLRHKMQLTNYTGPDGRQAVIPSSTFATLKGPRHLDNLVLKPVSPDRSAEVKAGILRVMAARRRFDPSDQGALRIWDTGETTDLMSKVMTGMRVFLGVIGGLSLLVAGVGVANIMIVMVQERVREIGIRMAVGARPGQITRRFLLEGLLTMAVGGGAGLGLSRALVGLASVLMNAIPSKEYREYMGHPVLSAGTALAVAAVLGLIGLAAAWVPARRAALVDPVEALRTE